MTDHRAAAMAMLGPAENLYADPAAWDRLQFADLVAQAKAGAPDRFGAASA